MITITGLTERQKQVIDLIWSCSTLEQATQLVKSLPTHKDRCDAHSLMQIVALESYEQDGGLDQYADIAKAAVDRARSC